MSYAGVRETISNSNGAEKTSENAAFRASRLTFWSSGRLDKQCRTMPSTRRAKTHARDGKRSAVYTVEINRALNSKRVTLPLIFRAWRERR
jgi:hypothetical protein